MESGLCIDGLYTMMLYLKGTDPTDYRAAKYPTALKGIEQQESGVYKVELAILNEDMAPTFDLETNLHDGYWHRQTSKTGIRVGDNIAQKGYFREYSSGIGDVFEALLADEVRRPRELVPAA